MPVALAMVFVVVASLAFHLLSPWRATSIASNWGYIDDTLSLTFWITSIGFVAVVLFIAFCLYRYHHQSGRRAIYQPENKRLEAWLSIITTVAVIGLLAPGLLVWGRFINVPEGASEIEIVGSQWNWSFRLPGADKKLGASDERFVDGGNPLGVNPLDPDGWDDRIITDGELHAPIGKPVKVLLRSLDVVHDFYIPQIRAKMDLMPGLVTYFWFTPTKAGVYEILCAAFCGMGHPQMRGWLIVESDSDYAKWLDKQPTFQQLRNADRQGEKRASTQ